MKKKVRRFWFYVRYRLIYDIKYGEGKWGSFYCAIANKYNPPKPGFWRRNKPPQIDLPDGYKKIVPLAYHTGDGWWLHWGALKNDDDMYPEPLCDVTDINDKSDYTIEEWPFFLPCASSADLAKAGFYEV